MRSVDCLERPEADRPLGAAYAHHSIDIRPGTPASLGRYGADVSVVIHTAASRARLGGT